MKLFVNPYTGQLFDFDALPVSPGGAIFCPTTGQPLNEEGVNQFSYAGPAEDRATWAADAMKTVNAVKKQANQDNAATLGVTGKK